MHLLSQLLAHRKNVLVRILLIGLGTQEDGIWQRDGYDILEESEIKGSTLKAVLQHE
jgi:hypothetical protein